MSIEYRYRLDQNYVPRTTISLDNFPKKSLKIKREAIKHSAKVHDLYR